MSSNGKVGAYDSQQDEDILVYEQDGLRVGLYSYKEGDPKLGMNRIFRNKTTGNTAYGKTGRLSLPEMEYLLQVLPEIVKEAKEIMEIRNREA